MELKALEITSFVRAEFVMQWRKENHMAFGNKRLRIGGSRGPGTFFMQRAFIDLRADLSKLRKL